MEGDELEMTKEELQKWIREKVKKNGLITSDVLAKCQLLQSVLDRREKQAAHLLKLCESVSACEANVRKLYSLLGWDYKDSDSDDDDNITGCGNTVPSSQLQDSENLHGDSCKKIPCNLFLKRRPVVVLTRLSTDKIRSLCRPTTQNCDSEDESLYNSDTDVPWEPEKDSSDSTESDVSISYNNSGSNKRRKLDHTIKKHGKSHAPPQASANTNAKINVKKTSTPQASANTDAKINATKTSAPQASANTDAKINVKKTSTPQASANMDAKINATKTSTPQASANTNAKINVTKTSTAPGNTTGVRPAVVSATKTPPSVPQGELKVNMTVMAKRRAMSWQQGTIAEIITKDGRLKYKISFEEKVKSLISGHHIAFDYMPKVEQLFVGARVVVKHQVEDCQFYAGTLAELPSRKNRMRFLVFKDDHTPLYVGLPLLRLVCRPLSDPLDDIPDGNHKDFMKQYMKDWPHPPQTQYRVGQTVNAKIDGVLQRCEVEVVDCSLMQVVVANQHKKWMYRGSTYLENMINKRGLLEMKKEDKQKNKSPTVKESSKSAR